MSANASLMAEERLLTLPCSAGDASVRKIVKAIMESDPTTREKYLRAFSKKKIADAEPEPFEEEAYHCEIECPPIDVAVDEPSFSPPIDDCSIDYENGRIPRAKWQEFAAEFLIFAREFHKKQRIDRSKKAQEAGRRKGGVHRAPSDSSSLTIESRRKFHVFGELVAEVADSDGCVTTAAFAEALNLSVQTARALLKRFRDLNWVEKRGSTIDARHRLTNLGREEFERLEEE